MLLILEQPAGPERLGEGTGWCGQGTLRSRISKSAEKFSGIEGLEVMEMSGQRENVRSGIVEDECGIAGGKCLRACLHVDARPYFPDRD